MPDLKGTKTHKNLKEAFAAESQANRRYLYFAKIADIDKKIDSLQKVKGALCELVDACARHRKSNECPILDSLDANGWFEQDAVTGKTVLRRSSVRSARKSSGEVRIK